MGAIFGIINKKGDAVDEAAANRMQEALLHRAVDGKGIYMRDNLVFGHHKLTVHRRQTQEKQPFELGDFVITSDARIDNIEELMDRLNLIEDIVTDSLIILKAFETWGNDCVQYLEGDFCFAIWNKATCSLFAACDHIGFRTFYFYENENYFAFASEIKALLVVKQEGLELNEQIFIDHYTNIKNPITFDKNIHVLQSAHYIELQDHKLIKKQYWRLNSSSRRGDFKKIVSWGDHIIGILTRKITKQIDSKYPIGIFLSGGLDSSFVAAIACELLQEQGRKLIAFCSVLSPDYKGGATDEKYYIEKLQEKYTNLEIKYISIPEDIGPYSGLTEGFESIEAPVNVFHYVEAALFKAAKEHNIRTILSGFGGDITISYNGRGVIYERILNLDLIKSFCLLRRRKKLAKLSWISIVKTEVLSHTWFYKKYKILTAASDHTYLPLNQDYLDKVSIAERDERSNYKKDFKYDMDNGMINLSLAEFRKHSIAFNQEFLSPLLTKAIVEIFPHIPGEEFILKGIKRSLIRGAMRKLSMPSEITERYDKGDFSPDCDRRIANLSVDFLRKILEDENDLIKSTGIDKNKLASLVSNFGNLDIEKNWVDEILYLPKMITAVLFCNWLNTRK